MMDVPKTNAFEQILLVKLADGDTSAFTAIFEAYYKDLVMFAFTFTKNSDSAEDTVQEVFVRLWEKRQELKLHGSLKSYLLKSVQNLCLDEFRRRKVREHYADDKETQSLYANNDTEDYILYTDLQNHLDNVLAQMPDEVAQTFRMNRFDGLKYHEIAQQLNVSLRTVESRISKALRIIHQAIEY
jgi:RNA polymerase sigma-70 factor (ECF subfamily)